MSSMLASGTRTTRMRHAVARRCLVAVFVLLPASAVGQGAYSDSATWARYERGTLGGVVSEAAVAAFSNLPAKWTGFAVGAPQPTRAMVVSLGQTRPLSRQRVQFIGAWLRSRGLDSAGVLALYKREALVREGTQRYWLPVQEVTWQGTPELWARNQRLVVLVQLVGARVVEGAPDWVFLVTTVEEPPDV